MGLLRYIVQGFGWEIGAQAAREGIDAIRDQPEPACPRSPSASSTASPSPARATRARARQLRIAAKKHAVEIERQLRELKKNAGK